MGRTKDGVVGRGGVVATPSDETGRRKLAHKTTEYSEVTRLSTHARYRAGGYTAPRPLGVPSGEAKGTKEKRHGEGGGGGGGRERPTDARYCRFEISHSSLLSMDVDSARMPFCTHAHTLDARND